MRDRTDGCFFATLPLALFVALAACDAGPERTPAATAAEDTSVTVPEPAPAPATTPRSGDVDRQFALMDGDADGRITTDEHATGASRMFATMDADGDARVTAAEMDAAQATLGGDARMSSADKIAVVDGDGDGILSREEHAAGALAMFGRMDADGDGALTRTELAAGHDAAMGGG
jgi:Ca2+-binding EF-hand superfamily protein